VTTSANSQLAVAGYLFEPGTGCFVPTALDVLTLKDGRITAVTGFLTIGALTPREQKRYRAASRLFATFGLPEQLSAV
jgi:hypothetical protein